jgi:hypothetical protein
MRLKWMGTALFAVALAVPATAQVSIYVQVGPPPIRYEEPPLLPLGRRTLGTSTVCRCLLGSSAL